MTPEQTPDAQFEAALQRCEANGWTVETRRGSRVELIYGGETRRRYLDLDREGILTDHVIGEQPERMALAGAAPGRSCPSCGALIPPGQRFCGQCGLTFTLAAPGIVRQIARYLIAMALFVFLWVPGFVATIAYLSSGDPDQRRIGRHP